MDRHAWDFGPDSFGVRLHPADLAQLAERGTVKRYGPASPVFHEGDASEWVGVVLDGSVRVSAVTTDGRCVTFADLGPGDLLGELSGLDGTPRSCSATAIATTDMLVVDGCRFRKWMAHHPRGAFALLEVAATRIRSLDRRHLDLVGADATARLARHLVEASVGATVTATHEDLAAWVCTSREAVSRSLAGFRRAGWIVTHRGRIEVRDANALRARGGLVAAARVGGP